MNGRQHAASSPGIHNTNGKREKGVVEKLLNSYGFLECSSTNYRVFFHYSEFDGDPNMLLIGGTLYKYLIFNMIYFFSTASIVNILFRLLFSILIVKLHDCSCF